MEQFQINHWAVLVCAVANLALGALWYSPILFYKAWMKENDFTEEDVKKVNPAKVYGLTLILSLIISYNLAFFLADGKTDMAWGATAGFLAGFGFSSLIFTVVALFEQRSWKYILINGGYITVYFTLIGFILGAWR
jgi:ABC-type spermidine/putrescine transport system permease subunit I